jgi:hypothetical protein
MDDSETEFYYNLVKGRIAENIAQELLVKLGYSVEKFGVENSAPQITKFLNRYKNSTVIKQISNMPDFLCFKNEKFKPFFAEVKYRHNAIIQKTDLERYCDYPELIFIIFSKKEIFCIQYSKELIENEDVRLDKGMRLIDSPLLKFTEDEKEVIRNFKQIAINIFAKIEPKMQNMDKVIST